jgi:mediator of RNA polymerase II transcription subunit 5
LHLTYIGLLVSRDLVSLAHMLTALRSLSAVKEPTTSPGADTLIHQGRETLEQDVFYILARVVRNNPPRSSESVWTAIQALSDWMEAVMAASGTGMLAGEADHENTMLSDSARGRLEALGELVIAVGANEAASKILGETGKKEKKLSFQSSLSLFGPYIQMHNTDLAQKLETLKRSHQSPRQSRNMKSSDGMDGMMMGLDDGQPAIPVVWSRYHLFVWLNGLVGSRSLLDAQPHC